MAVCILNRHKKPNRPEQHPQGGRSSSAVRVRQTKNGWELVPPRCARERAEDLEEVAAMIAGGEEDIAIDELRWLLNGCSDFVEAHRLLGELHLTHDQDLSLARAHFGYAYQIGLAAIRRSGGPSPLPYGLTANQPFFEAGKGLAYCLKELSKPEMAREVLEELLRLDPTDPLGARNMLAQLPEGS